jgi:uncharacterized membrane protein
MGKFANLLFYCIVIYFALKITPYYKNVMFMIALMPMSIFLGASLNYDSILISSTLYYFAILMKILHSEEGYRITTKDIISVCFAAFWMVGIKQMYAPLLLLLFMVPVKKFKDKKQYITAIGSVVLTGIAAYLPAVIVNAKLSGIGNVQSEIEQKQYVMNHAVHFLYIMFRTFKEQLSSYMLSFVGSLGNLDTVFSAPVLFAFILMLLLVSIFDISRVPETALKLRISSAILLLFIIMASCYAMYVSWTSLPEIGGIGYPVVVGLQGRYFIPAYVFGIMIFSNRLLLDVPFFQKHIPAVERKMDCLVKITMIMMGILTVLLLLLRYYI